jgi:hypothetical protein
LQVVQGGHEPRDEGARSTEAGRVMITKEEFGLNLYDVIHTIGGIMALDEHIDYCHTHSQGWRIQGLSQRREVLQKQLAAQLPLLTDDEDQQIRARYPFVVTL